MCLATLAEFFELLVEIEVDVVGVGCVLCGGDFFSGFGFVGFAELGEDDGADGLHFTHGVARVIGIVA